jgi:hypothetical protein
MKAIRFTIAALLVCAFTSAAYTAEGKDAPPEVMKGLEEKVDKLLKAYNDNDWKAFYTDYAKSMSALATEPTFKMLYVDKGLGKIVSKKLIDKETVSAGDFPLLVYEAEFEKDKKIKVSVNFTKEDGQFKVMQVQFNKMQ